MPTVPCASLYSGCQHPLIQGSAYKTLPHPEAIFPLFTLRTHRFCATLVPVATIFSPSFMFGVSDFHRRTEHWVIELCKGGVENANTTIFRCFGSDYHLASGYGFGSSTVTGELLCSFSVWRLLAFSEHYVYGW